MKKILSIVLLLSAFGSFANEEGKKEVMQCLEVHNSLEKRIKKFSPEERFDFAVLFVEKYFTKEEADQLRSKKSEFLANEENANAYVSMLTMKWTESCVEDAAKKKKQ